MHLIDFVEYFSSLLFDVYWFSKSIFPFDDFPLLSLWDIFTGGFLLSLCFLFIPGCNFLDDSGEGFDDDPDIKQAYFDWEDSGEGFDDFDDF